MLAETYQAYGDPGFWKQVNQSWGYNVFKIGVGNFDEEFEDQWLSPPETKDDYEYVGEYKYPEEEWNIFAYGPAFFSFTNGFTPHEFQAMVMLDENQEITCRIGRQGGKSQVVATKAFHYALTNQNKVVVIISPTRDQSGIIFDKIRVLIDRNKHIFGKYIRDMTKTMICFDNGSKIFVRAGTSIRGYTIDMLIVDEAAFVTEDVFVAAKATQAGIMHANTIYISTPLGKVGTFHDSHTDPFFSKYHVRSKDLSHVNTRFLLREQERLSKFDYMREYDAEFIEHIGSWMPMTLLSSSIFTFKRANQPQPFCTYFLGVDVAGEGTDETVYAIWERDKYGTMRLIHIEGEEISNNPAVEGRIKYLHNYWNFQCIAIDGTGMGGPTCDDLIADGLPVIKVVFSKLSEYSDGKWTHKTAIYQIARKALEDCQAIRNYNNRIEEQRKPDCTLPAKFKRPLIMLYPNKRLIAQSINLRYEFTKGGQLSIEPNDPAGHDDYPDGAWLGYYAAIMAPMNNMAQAAAH